MARYSYGAGSFPACASLYSDESGTRRYCDVSAIVITSGVSSAMLCLVVPMSSVESLLKYCIFNASPLSNQEGSSLFLPKQRLPLRSKIPNRFPKGFIWILPGRARVGPIACQHSRGAGRRAAGSVHKAGRPVPIRLIRRRGRGGIQGS